jgi:branched-chain amino acid aminotransferase
MSSIFYIDGEFVSAEEARIPATDLAVLRGYGVFDFTRTYHRRPFHLDAHLDRLYRSAEQVLLDIPWSKAEITDIVMETIARNPDYAECNVRIVVTGGESPDFLNPADRPRLLVLITPATIMPERAYAEGVYIVTVQMDRVLTGAKSINYIPAIIALRHARKQGALDAVYIDNEGRVLEGTTNNLFAFYGDTLVTPGDEHVLLGITRGIVLELAETAFTVEHRDITLDELYTADEIFLSSSVKEVLAVTRINDRTIADGRPGVRTQRLLEMFREIAWQRVEA